MGVNSINLFSASIFTASAATAPIPEKNAPGFPDAGLMARNARIPAPTSSGPVSSFRRKARYSPRRKRQLPPSGHQTRRPGSCSGPPPYGAPSPPAINMPSPAGPQNAKAVDAPCWAMSTSISRNQGDHSPTQRGKLHPGHVLQFFKTPGIIVQRLLFPSPPAEAILAVYGQLSHILRSLCRHRVSAPPQGIPRRGGNANREPSCGTPSDGLHPPGKPGNPRRV